MMLLMPVLLMENGGEITMKRRIDTAIELLEEAFLTNRLMPALTVVAETTCLSARAHLHNLHVISHFDYEICFSYLFST